MKSSVEIMGWVSILIATSILGMGGAPIAEKFEISWLVVVLTWISYFSIGLLSIATFIIGGLGLYHGILTILGKEVGTVRRKPGQKSLHVRPRVEGPKA